MRDWRMEERNRLGHQIANETYEEDGALFWKSNDAAVPMDCFRDADLTPPPAQAEAVRTDVARAIERYCEAQACRTPEQLAEEAFEMRAAFGPGETVVNILTGEKTIT